MIGVSQGGPGVKPIARAAPPRMADGSRVVVLGEALIDLIASVDGAVRAVPGGSPFNIARAIARLGLDCAWVGALADDALGQRLREALSRDLVDVSLVQRSRYPTTLALAELAADGVAEYRFYVAGTAAPDLHPFVLPVGACALLTGSFGLVLEPMATTIEAAIRRLSDTTILMIDPNARPSAISDIDAWRRRVHRVMARTDIVKASRDDLTVLYPGRSLDAACDALAAAGPRITVVTDGGDPVRVRCGDQTWTQTVENVEVADTIGAGDTFAGALLAYLVHAGYHRSSLLDAEAFSAAVAFAARASAETCRRVGANPPTIEDLGGW